MLVRTAPGSFFGDPGGVPVGEIADIPDVGWTTIEMPLPEASTPTWVGDPDHEPPRCEPVRTIRLKVATWREPGREPERCLQANREQVQELVAAGILPAEALDRFRPVPLARRGLRCAS